MLNSTPARKVGVLITGKGVRTGSGGTSPANVRFGPFELDVTAGELRKQSHRIRLQEQPFQILRMLLEAQGSVVSRDEIRRRLWPDDTVVEFDHSINAAVRRLRDALRESADKPRYIETVARRGYRFIGEVATPAEPEDFTPATATEKMILAPVPVRRSNRRLYYLATAAIATLAISASAWYFFRVTRGFQPTLHPLVRLDVELGRDGFSNGGRGAGAIFSPDGSRLVFVSQSKLFTRTLDGSETQELPGTEGAYAPFFSPDGKWVAFFARGKLKKVSVADGRSAELCSVSLANGGSWGEDGNIIAAVDASVLSRIPASGGSATHVATLASGEMIQRWPQILPGSRAVLFTSYGSMTGSETANIDVVSLTDGRRKTLIRGGTFGRYAPTGHLLFINKGTLLAVPFDATRLEVRGTPVPLLEGVEYSTAWGYAQLGRVHTNKTLMI